MLTRGLVFHVASGQSFFSGAACLILAVGVSAFTMRPRLRVARNALVYLGGALVFVSATPLPSWSYLLLLAASILWLAAEAARGRVPARAVVAMRVVVAVAWLSAVLAELPYHRLPAIPRLGRPTLGIIGDSVTAGMGQQRVVTWPRILEGRHGVVVRDHSQMGATVGSAAGQAASLTSDERLIVLEIGGNDILGTTTPAEFEARLARLLAAVRRPGRVAVMLELPLPPTYNAYGRIQRRLARRYGTLLVPRRVLLGILQYRGSTLDAIHLTQEGHRRMADAVWNVVGAAYADGRWP